jgi:hypothetical protein
MEGDLGVSIRRALRSPGVLVIDGRGPLAPLVTLRCGWSAITGGGNRFVDAEGESILGYLRRRWSKAASSEVIGFKIEATPADREAGEKLPLIAPNACGSGGSSKERAFLFC